MHGGVRTARRWPGWPLRAVGLGRLAASWELPSRLIIRDPALPRVVAGPGWVGLGCGLADGGLGLGGACFGLFARVVGGLGGGGWLGVGGCSTAGVAMSLDSSVGLGYVDGVLRLSVGPRGVHRGSGWGRLVLLVDLQACITGFGRGAGSSFDEGAWFSVVSVGRNVLGACGTRWGTVVRCASLALTHLSLSLSFSLFVLAASR